MRVGLFLLLSLVVHMTASQWLDWRTPSRPSGPLMTEQATAVTLPRLVRIAEPSPVEPVATPVPEPVVISRPEPPAHQPEPPKREPLRPQPVAQPPAVKPPSVEPTTVSQAAPVEQVASAPQEQVSPPVVEPAPAEPVEVVSQAPRFREPPAAPVYPTQARRRNQQGRVLVAVRLDAAGEQRELTLVQSSGFTSLDQAALEAVAGWKFQPELQAGRALPSRVQIPIDFALNTRR